MKIKSLILLICLGCYLFAFSPLALAEATNFVVSQRGNFELPYPDAAKNYGASITQDETNVSAPSEPAQNKAQSENQPTNQQYASNIIICYTGIFGMCCIIYAIARLLVYISKRYEDAYPGKDPVWLKALAVLSIILYIIAFPATIILGGINSLHNTLDSKRDLSRINTAYKIGQLDMAQRDKENQIFYANLITGDTAPASWTRKAMHDADITDDDLHRIGER